MSETREVVAKARELGALIAEHEAARQVEAVARELEADTEAQRLLTDYRRHLTTIAEKQQNQQPIEPEEKKRLEEAQAAVIRHPLLRKLQTAQMDYADLMRQVNEAITGEGTPEAGEGGAAVLDAPMP